MTALSRLARVFAAFPAVVGLVLGVAGSAFAGSYAVQPSTFTLVPPERNATMTLTNLSSEPIRLQVSGVAWSENENGTMLLTRAPGIVIFPQFFTIPALGTQVVRAAVVTPLSTTEQTFRIVIEDMPPLGEIVHAAPGMRISMRTRFTLAVYVEPALPAPSSRIEDVRVREGVLTFAVRNTGNTHLAGASLSVDGRDASGRSVFSKSVNDWHVLAGERHVYAFNLGTATCSRNLTISLGAGAVPPAQTFDVAACQ
jgi:fimbrial chaperone protein